MMSNTSLEVPQNADTNMFKVTASPGVKHQMSSTNQTYITVFDIMTLAKRNKGSKTTAHECALWFCMKSYDVSIADGTLNHTLLEVWSKTQFEESNSAHPDEYQFVDIPPSMNVQDQSRYSVSDNSVKALQSFMNSLTEGTFETQFDIVNFSSDWIEAMWNATTDLPTWIQRLSISLTNEVRERGTVRDTRSRSYEGNATIMSAYIVVQWRWLAYPASLILISLYYLFHTIIEGARDGVSVWKSDSLPMLFSRIDASILAKVGDGMDVPHGLDDRVGNVKICLLREEDGDWVFKPLEESGDGSESD